MNEMNFGFIELSDRLLRDVLNIKDLTIVGVEWKPETRAIRIIGYSDKFKLETPEGCTAYRYPIKIETRTLVSLEE